MDSRWEGYFHLGIVYPKLFSHANSGEGPIVETLSKLLNDPFFSAIEVTWIKNDELRRKVRNLLKISGLKVLFNGAPAIRGMGINLCTLDAEQRQTSVENFKKVIDEAYFLGAKILHCVSGKDPGPSERETAKHQLFDSLRQLCQYALDHTTDYTLVLSLENSDRDCDRMALLGPTDETVDLAKKIRKEYSNFGILLDQGHFPLMKEDPDKSLELAKGLLTPVCTIFHHSIQVSHVFIPAKDKGKYVLGNSNRIDARSIGNIDASLGAGVDVHIVKAGSGMNKFEMI